MRNWQINAVGTEEVAVLLFPRFSNHCLANAVEPLRAANDFLMREAYRWQYTTLDGTPVASSSGLPVLPHRCLQDHPGGEFLFVASSYDVRSYATPATSRALNEAARRFRHIVGLDTGAWLMAHASLLDGTQATVHWDELVAFSETFVDVYAVEAKYVIGRNVMTCGGAMTAFDLVLELIGRRHGEALKLEVASLFQHHSTVPIQHQLYVNSASPLVSEALALMSANIETPLQIADLAARVQTTQRGLNRAFHAELGAPPQTVYKRLRVAMARRYAQQSNHSIAEIAVRCGYRNAAAMTRAFGEQYQISPSALRSRLGE